MGTASVSILIPHVCLNTNLPNSANTKYINIYMEFCNFTDIPILNTQTK